MCEILVLCNAEMYSSEFYMTSLFDSLRCRLEEFRRPLLAFGNQFTYPTAPIIIYAEVL